MIGQSCSEEKGYGVENSQEIQRCEVHRAWVVCSPSNSLPIQIVRVSESWESVDDEGGPCPWLHAHER